MTTPIQPLTTSPSLATAARAANTDERTRKVQSAARDFETILVKQLLAAAKMGGDGKGGYGDMAVDALADGIEKGGGLGLTDQIARALSGGSGPTR